MSFKDTLVTGLLIAFLILFAKAAKDPGLTIDWVWDGTPHHHVLRIK